MKNEVNKEFTTNLSINALVREPALYQVVIHNDDFTPMEFVVEVLEKCFYMERWMAAELMLKAHLQGRAGWGRFSKDYAETKVAQMTALAKRHQYPLVCSMEAE